MYKIQDHKAIKVEEVTFSELNLVENDIEELLRTNIDMICDEEESMLIVGRRGTATKSEIWDHMQINSNYKEYVRNSSDIRLKSGN